MKKFLWSFILVSISYLGHAEEISQAPLQKEQVDEATSGIAQGIPSSDYQKVFIKMLISLGLLLALLVLTLWAFRRLVKHRQKQANDDMVIKIVEKRVLSPKSMLYLIEIENKRILLSESTLEVRSHKILDDTLWQDKS